MASVTVRIETNAGLLDEPAESARGHWQERTGLVLFVTDQEGRTGVGEASPLPGYSPDTLDECRGALQEHDFEQLPASPESSSFVLELGEWSEPLSRVPAARFAAETAALDLLGQTTGAALWQLLGVNAAPPIPISALLPSGDTEAVLETARRALGRGVTTLKRKLHGEASLDDDIRILKALRSAFGSRFRLRLDANGAFPPAVAPDVLRRLAALDVEFVEEPVPSESLRAFASPSVPLALDESLRDETLCEHLAALDPSWQAVVVKPTLLGGFARCVHIATRARSLGLGVVVTHTWDGPIALTAAAHLAFAIATPRLASGIDRHTGLDAWPHMELPWLEGGAAHALSTPGLGLEAEFLRRWDRP